MVVLVHHCYLVQRYGKFISFFWLVVSNPLKNIMQLGWLFPIYGKMKNVRNQHPVLFFFPHHVPSYPSPYSTCFRYRDLEILGIARPRSAATTNTSAPAEADLMCGCFMMFPLKIVDLSSSLCQKNRWYLTNQTVEISTQVFFIHRFETESFGFPESC